MGRCHPRAELYLKDRELGMKYRDIAEKYGVSYQAVSQVCAQYSPQHFRKYTEEECIYPNLRRWLNENKVSKSELLRRLGRLPASTANVQISGWFTGKTHPEKKNIDKLLTVTGLTYEQLFAMEEQTND